MTPAWLGCTPLLLTAALGTAWAWRAGRLRDCVASYLRRAPEAPPRTPAEEAVAVVLLLLSAALCAVLGVAGHLAAFGGGR